MHIEVDQSIKIEQSGATVLAFANGITCAVIIPAKVKQVCLEYLYYRGKSRQIAPLILFSAGIYILIEPYLKQLKRIVIDVEYDGKNNDIKSFLLELIKKHYSKCYDHNKILFKHIGKKSSADKKARNVRTKKDKVYKKLTKKDLFKIMI